MSVQQFLLSQAIVAANPGIGSIWNTADKSAGIALSDSSFVATNAATSSGQSVRGVTSQLNNVGKWYLEFQDITLEDNSDFIGFANATYVLGVAAGNANCLGFSQDGTYCVGSSFPSSSNGSPNGKTVCFALDTVAHRVWFRQDAGLWNASGTANPATNTGGFSLAAGLQATLFPCARLRHIAGAPTARLVTGAYTSAGAHAFLQTVPSGFSPWS